MLPFSPGKDMPPGSAFRPVSRLGRYRFRSRSILAVTALLGAQPAWPSFGGSGFGAGFALVLWLMFVLPPFLAAVLAGALAPRRRAAILGGIVAGAAVSALISAILFPRGDWLVFAGLGAVAGLVGGVLAWLWRLACSAIADKGSAGTGDGRLAGAESPALWRDGIVARFWRWSAWGRRARVSVRRFWVDLKSTGPAWEWSARPVLKEKLGYGIALGLAGLALSPTVLMELAERVASASGPGWLTALSVAVAGGLPLLRVVPSMLNVMAAALLGPWWGAGVMLSVAALLSANFAGYPELPYAGVFGVMVAGLVYRATGKAIYVVLGEIVGTGMIGAIANAALGIYATDTTFDWPGWVAMLLLPTSIGAVLGGIALVAMGRAGPSR